MGIAIGFLTFFLVGALCVYGADYMMNARERNDASDARKQEDIGTEINRVEDQMIYWI